MAAGLSKEEREFAMIISRIESMKFEKAKHSISAYVTASELSFVKELAEKLGCSQSEVIRRACRLYAMLQGYENMGGEIIARPGESMTAWGGKEINLSERIEMRGGAAE